MTRDRLPAGPYRMITTADGGSAPFYVMPFDKRGICTGPATRRHLLDRVRTGGFSDVFVFSHGWNNDWSAATARYDHFLGGFTGMCREHGLSMPEEYRPLLIGVFWPSTALAFGEDESGPDFAGAGGIDDGTVARERLEVSALAEELAADDLARFYELVQRDALDHPEALELARIARVFFARVDDEVEPEEPPTPEEIVAIWSAMKSAPPSAVQFGNVVDASEDDPQAAGWMGRVARRLDPRPAVRLLTVYQMKDRAGRVGAHGVGPLLRDLLSPLENGKPSTHRVHLIGHSYGGKVVLSATGHGGDLPRRVRSMLLLQPAVSHLCFADRVPDSDRAGGYRAVLDRVELPILTTFSRHDFALRRQFHLTLRRQADLGEARVAAADDPPSAYAALGGYGPRCCGESLIDIHDVNDRYELDRGVPVYGVRGDRTISGHGDISNESTWWALYDLASNRRV